MCQLLLQRQIGRQPVQKAHAGMTSAIMYTAS